MPGTTSINALRYTLLTDAPANIQTATNNLASDVDTRLVARFTNTTLRDAAISSPTEGMLVYIGGTTNTYQFYNGSAWEKVGRSRKVYKQNDQGYQGTGFANDNDLFITCDANKTYVFDMTLFTTQDSAGDIKFRLTFPSGQLDWGIMGLSWAAGGNGTTADVETRGLSGTSSPSSDIALGGWDAGRNMVLIRGLLRNTGTAGNLRLQAGQVVNSNTSYVMNGSWMLVEEV